MTAGGLDLSPHLLDTFIRLGKGVPTELADGINRKYAAYVLTERHEANCLLLAQAYRNLAARYLGRADELEKKQGA